MKPSEAGVLLNLSTAHVLLLIRKGKLKAKAKQTGENQHGRCQQYDIKMKDLVEYDSKRPRRKPRHKPEEPCRAC